MIKSFKHKGLKRFFETGNTSGIQTKHTDRLSDLLNALDNAYEIEDLNRPSFRLHRLKGNRQTIWSITVNGNWRLTFEFLGNDVFILDYEDYH